MGAGEHDLPPRCYKTATDTERYTFKVMSAVTNSYAIASSYLIRQSPGAERIGGATVRICRRRRGETGALNVQLTDFWKHKPLGPDASFLTGVAQAALATFAESNAVSVDEWDIDIYDFAYHPVDTTDRIMRIAIHNALTSAFSTWHSRTPNMPERSQSG